MIKDVRRKRIIVDDTLLYGSNIEDWFFNTWVYLYICAIAGIVINDRKFKFCRGTVEFVGLKLTTTGIVPSDHILLAIKNFTKPADLTNARSWCGLVNHIAWAYSTSPIRELFQELVKHKATFQWNLTLDQLFQQSKELLISKVEEGITIFDINRPMCLQTDWIKTGIGYLLLFRSCSNDHAQLCCSDGWRLVFASSRFLTPTESRYLQTEGETLAVVWSLENAKSFVLGCQNLIDVMDHKPLLGIFDNREISNIPSPRISSLKENSLCYAFRTAYCLGKWHRGADAVSRNPTHNPSDSTISTRSNASDIDIAYAERTSDQLHQKIASHIQALEQRDNNSHPDINNYTISTKLAQEYISDPTYQLLAIKIKNGFPNTQEQLDPKIRDYCDTRNHLTVIGNIILMDSQIVIPISMRKYVLSTLHVAHQGVTSMCS